MSSDPLRAIVVVLDGLGAGYLGPYGNTWIETPAFNRLASQSWLLEQATIDSASLNGLYRSFWSGRHAALSGQPSGPSGSLLQRLADAGVATLLITDEPACAQHPLAEAFERTQLMTADDDSSMANAVEDTGLARLTAAVIDALAGDAAQLIWVHGRALQAAWDAPWDFRRQFSEEGDPDPPCGTTPPSFLLEPDYDPDLLQGWLWAYAGQVTLLDLCLQPLLAMLDRLAPPPLLMVTGARGYPLGEHGALGAAATGLYSELLHVPLLIRAPSRDVANLRSSQLVQPGHLFASLCEWFHIDLEEDRPASLWNYLDKSPGAWPELAVCVAPGQYGLRTPGWLARLTSRSDAGGPNDLQPWDCELFLKPDDRWDTNDVASRCPEVVQAFHRLLKQLGSYRDQAADWSSVLPLEELLRGAE